MRSERRLCRRKVFFLSPTPSCAPAPTLFLSCRGRFKEEVCSGEMALVPLDCIFRPVYGGRGERLTRGGHCVLRDADVGADASSDG